MDVLNLFTIVNINIRYSVFCPDRDDHVPVSKYLYITAVGLNFYNNFYNNF